MHKNKNDISKYVKTILWTIFFSLILAIVFFMFTKNQAYEEVLEQQKKDKTINYATVDTLISKTKELEENEPSNYRANLKLGILYEIKQENDKAEEEYKKSISKAPYNRYKPTYRLARLYIKINQLEKSQKLIDSIGEKPYKKLIKYKGDIYNRLGDSYYNKGDYLEAALKYQKSISYYKIIKAKKECRRLMGNLASSYVYLAEEKIEKIEIEEAIHYLNLANDIINAPILKYKLALLLIKDNPKLSYKYFQEVFEEEPKLINYDVYYAFLSGLAMEAVEKNHLSEAELYKLKIRKLKEYYGDNILSTGDITLDVVKGNFSFNNLAKRYNINLKLRLKNNSKFNINSLYLYIVFKDEQGSIVEKYSSQIINDKMPLKIGEKSTTISIKTFGKTPKKGCPFGDQNNKLNVQIYVSKTQSSYKLLLETFTIGQNTKKSFFQKISLLLFEFLNL